MTEEQTDRIVQARKKAHEYVESYPTSLTKLERDLSRDIDELKMKAFYAGYMAAKEELQ